MALADDIEEEQKLLPVSGIEDDSGIEYSD